MHPILFHIGSFQVGTYGLFVALGALASLFLMEWLGKKEGFPEGAMGDLFLWVVIGALLGSKILLIIGDFSSFAADPLGFLWRNLRSFGAFYGGLLAGILAGWIFTRRRKLVIGSVADVVAPALILAQGIGRWGCFFAGAGPATHTTGAFTVSRAHSELPPPHTLWLALPKKKEEKQVFF